MEVLLKILRLTGMEDVNDDATTSGERYNTEK